MRALSQIYDLCDRKLKIQLVQLFCLISVLMVLEIASVGMFLPLIQLFIDPTRLSDLPLVGRYVGVFSGIDQAELLIWFAFGLLAFFVVKNICMGLAIAHQNRIIFAAQTDLQKRLLTNYIRQPYLFHLARNSSESVRTIMISAPISLVGVLQPVLNIIIESVLALGVIAILMAVEPFGTFLIVTYMMVALTAVYMLFRAPLLSWGRKIEKLTQRMFQTINEIFGAYKELSLRQRTGWVVNSFASLAHTRGDDSAARSTANQIPRLAGETFVIGAVTIMIIVTANRSDSIQATLPVLGIFAAAGLRILPAANRILNYLTTLRGNLASLENVHAAIFPAVTAMSCDPDGRAPGPAENFQEIRFEHIDFVYPENGRSALTDVSFSVKKGDRIGIVGPSGAGKSTLADILLGMLAPSRGGIYIDGTSIEQNLPAWQTRLGYVPQSIYICDDTVRRNIALATDDAEIDELRIERAIRAANLEQVISQLSDGLDTVLGENGARLSGGQRQRIGIARALYHEPDVIVFDEATSALDNETEKEISRTIAELSTDKTVFTIAHRIDTMKSCQCLVFLSGGNLIDQGTFDDLLRRNDLFRRMTQTSADDAA
jgi:ATP-binding cassette subfamily C protein